MNNLHLILSIALLQTSGQLQPDVRRSPRATVMDGQAISQPRTPSALATIPLANGDFEHGQVGWTGTIARYTGPAVGERVPGPAALGELRKIGGNYWQASTGVAPSLASPRLLPVQGEWYGSNV